MKKTIFKAFAGRMEFQKYFRMMHTLAVYGMNYGNGGDFRTSGEYFAANYVKNKLATLTSDHVLFDVGANIGDYAIKLAEIFVDHQYEIHVFEPSKKTYEQLISNLSQKKRIKTNNVGLSDKESTQALYSNSDGSVLASVYERKLDHHGINMDKKEDIKLTTIDRYCEENGLEKIDFLKLDIEGHELSALKGAEKMIAANKIRFVQFEFGGTNIDSRTFFKDFWDLLKDKYHFYRIVKNGLFPITKYSEECEIFNTINYFLELKS